MIDQALAQVLSGKDLSVSEASSVLRTIFEGSVETDQLVQFLDALAEKGESVSEIVGFATVMREQLIPVPLEGDCLDLCGTGGSGKDRFNVSTASAFVLASLGVPVAKHGNRGSRKANGSFDFLEALGVRLDLSPEEVQRDFDSHHLAFLFARNHHPGMRFVGEARQKVGRRTIFNLLGPLCSPAGVTHHVLGTIDWGVAEKLAQALQDLGITRAFVVVGDGGMDEFSVTGPSRYIDVTQDALTVETLDPEVYGLATLEPPAVGFAVQNAALFKVLLETPDFNHPVLCQVILNSAMGLVCMGRSQSVSEAISDVRDAFKTGAVQQFFKGYIQR